jgi:hypothetical protein
MTDLVNVTPGDEMEKGIQMMFLECPAYLDDDGAALCGLPAEVKCSYTMQSTDGALDSVMIRCPSGHLFNGPLEFLTPKNGEGQDARTLVETGAGFPPQVGRVMARQHASAS